MMSVYESIDVLKLALDYRIVLEGQWKRGREFCVWRILGLRYRKEKYFIFFP